MNILFISNNTKKCGVGEYGRQIASGMSKYSKNTFRPVFVDPEEKFENFQENVEWCDLIFVNYYPLTLPYSASFLSKIKNKPIVGLIHNYKRQNLELYDMHSDIFRYRIHSDPTLVSQVPNVFSVPRMIPDAPVSAFVKNDIFTVGTLGLHAFKEKDFEKIIYYVEQHYDNANIRIHVPFGEFAVNGSTIEETKNRLDNLKNKITKSGIKLFFTHDYLEEDEMISFLSHNDLNVSFYHKDAEENFGGIASTPDLLIAAERPVALTDCYAFRHIRYYAPEFFIDVSSLDTILSTGLEKVLYLKNIWSQNNTAGEFDKILDAVWDDWSKPQQLRYNTILNDDMRKMYHDQIENIAALCPIEYARKIPRANVRQAFVKTIFEKYATQGGRFLCVGSYEDTAYLSLQKEGYNIEGIDPVINRDLNEHYKYWNNTLPYDIIFSTSVIEHVVNDSEFVYNIAKMLSPGGYIILTMDFKSGWKETEPVISGDFRFYSTKHILERLIPFMPYCEMVDFYDWDQYPPDFDFGGFTYSFATLVLRKKEKITLLDEICYERNRAIVERLLKLPYHSMNKESRSISFKEKIKKRFPILVKIKRKLFS